MATGDPSATLLPEAILPRIAKARGRLANRRRTHYHRRPACPAPTNCARWSAVAVKRKRGRRAPPQTDRRLLAVLPRFGPARGFDIHHVDIKTGTFSRFTPQRRTKIRRLLTECLEPYVRTDEPNALERFLQEAEHNIAFYIGERNAQQAMKKRPAFNHDKAEDYLLKATRTVHATQKELLAIAGWPELSSFFERLSVQVRKWRKGKSPNSFLHGIALTERAIKEVHAVQPKHMTVALFQLEQLLLIAGDRVAFQSGEDDAARNFVDAMASAWFDATGRLPTCARRSIRSRGRSPFAELLRVTNQKIFKPRLRSRNDFFEYGVKSVSRIKALARVSRRSRRSKRAASR